MHRNMLSTRLESQEGRDRLKCLAIYVHQKTSSDKSMKDGVQNTWDSLELGSQELKEWRGQWPLQPETQRHPHISTTAKVGRASPFWYSLLFFKFLLLQKNFQRLNFFPHQVFKKIFTLKNYFCFSLKLDNFRRYNFFYVSFFVKFYKWLSNAKRNCLKKWGCPF